MSKLIGILGGSFDPIHIGHLIIAQDAAEQFELDRVLFVPARQAPLKSKDSTATPEQRLAMARLAVADNARFAISEVDLQGEGISYSVDTARRLKEAFPDADLCWIIGADQVAQLHRWRAIEQLAALVSFIVFERPGSPATPSAELPGHLKLLRAQARQIDISSTEIRRRLQSGASAKYFLPPPVFDYIKAENLYLEDETAI